MVMFVLRVLCFGEKQANATSRGFFGWFDHSGTTVGSSTSQVIERVSTVGAEPTAVGERDIDGREAKGHRRDDVAPATSAFSAAGDREPAKQGTRGE